MVCYLLQHGHDLELNSHVLILSFSWAGVEQVVVELWWNVPQFESESMLKDLYWHVMVSQVAMSEWRGHIDLDDALIEQMVLKQVQV